MSCPRCQGLLVPVVAEDVWLDAAPLPQRRCVNCGYRDDPVLRANAAAPPPDVRGGRKQARLPGQCTELSTARARRPSRRVDAAT